MSQTANGAYRQAFDHLSSFGEIVDVRGRKTVEVLNYVTEIEHPEQRVITLPGRRWNPFLAMSEILWFFSGRNDIAPLLPFNKNIVDYSDDGATLNGSAYGFRLQDQIEGVIARLKADPNDRRAVLTVWEKKDLMAVTKDPPCNDMIMLKLRGGKLHLTVLNRSNDIHYGLYAVNFPVFSALQEYIAWRLGAQMGRYTHFSNSLHFYTDDPYAARITERMDAGLKYLYTDVKGAPMFDDSFLNGSLEHVSKLANAALDTKVAFPFFSDWPPFFRFARLFLAWKLTGEKVIHDDLKELWPDWIAAGEAFLEGRDVSVQLPGLS